MRCRGCLGLMILVFYTYTVGTAQIPLRSPTLPNDAPKADVDIVVVPNNHPDQWDLERRPDSNSTSNYIFDSVASVLQHWTNTRYRNGHAIIPGIIPPGTLLYHGRGNNSLPTVPEWVATDPEHSYLFCRSWHLTLVATRSLNILYFDGTSAANMVGPLDTQDLLVWGELGALYDDRRRIVDLCAWGRQYALDGFVRMEMDFEIMLCNFTSGVEVVSFLNLTVPDIRRRRQSDPGQDSDRKSFYPLYESNSVYRGVQETDAPPPPGRRWPVEWPQPIRWFEVLHSGSWHNYYPGEVRIRLDLARLVSFYDIDLVPSLVTIRKGQERWNHRVYGVGKEDLDAVRRRLEAALDRSGEWEDTSSVDWQTLVRVIVDRYGERLELLEYVLNAEEGSLSDLPQRASKAFLQLRIMLTPYLLASAVPLNSSAPNSLKLASTSWASPIFRLCATTHTSYIISSLKLTPSERLILGSIQGTTREICSVLVGMWAEGIQAGLNSEDRRLSPEKLQEVTTKWKADLKALMTWLDWSMWARCKPSCSFEEMCYMPTWPFFDGKRPPSRVPDKKHQSRPEPICIRRIDPYDLV